MTVKELKEQLADLPDDLLVVLQDDDEGNGYRHCNGIDADNLGLIGEHQYDYEVHFLSLTKELIEKGYTEEDIHSDAKPCGVLY